jgi:hypothetical protein
MQIRFLLIVTAVLATIHGLGFVLLPAAFLSFYGLTAGAAEQLLGQLLGAELLVVAIVTWLGRKLTEGKALGAIVVAMLISAAVGTVVTVEGTLNTPLSVTGWLAVAIYALLTLGYAYFQFSRPRAA